MKPDSKMPRSLPRDWGLWVFILFVGVAYFFS
jgi:hypothetical protein